MRPPTSLRPRRATSFSAAASSRACPTVTMNSAGIRSAGSPVATIVLTTSSVDIAASSSHQGVRSARPVRRSSATTGGIVEAAIRRNDVGRALAGRNWCTTTAGPVRAA